MFELAIDNLRDAQAWLFEILIMPIVRILGLTAYSGAAFNGVEIFLFGLVEVILLYIVLRPLELWRPVERFEIATERRTDIVYTLLHRLGGFALITFAIVSPLLDEAESWLRLFGLQRFQLDALPIIGEYPWALFAIYLVILDFADYWMHRWQHRFHWWWQLHALHHANPSISLWSDNRNHLIDDVIRDIVLAVLSWFIGVQPEQYLLWIALTRILQSFQHANIDTHLGRWGGYVLVSPHFHRTHHSIYSGTEGKALGCNFGVVFPWWDMVFGTAKYHAAIEPTGVQDSLTGRNYGQGFWAQQKQGVLRLLGRA